MALRQSSRHKQGRHEEGRPEIYLEAVPEAPRCSMREQEAHKHRLVVACCVLVSLWK